MMSFCTNAPRHCGCLQQIITQKVLNMSWKSFISTTPASLQNYSTRHGKKQAPQHWYETEVEMWGNRKQLITQLLDGKIYEDENILVLNKPVGLPMHGPKYTEESIEDIKDLSDVSMSSILDDLKRKIESDNLDIVYSQNRLYSGLVVLTKNQNTKNQLSKYFVHARTNKIQYQKYWTVTVGTPQPPQSDNEMIHITQERVDGWKLSVLSKQASTRQRRRHQMINVELSMAAICTRKSSQHQVSLVEISPSTTKWDAVPLYLLHKLSPALGDHKYSGRLTHVLGRPVIHDHRRATPRPQVLPFGLQSDLQLPANIEDMTAIIPLHMHCRQLSIPRLHANRSHRTSRTLTLEAPVPGFFSKTLKLCNIVPEEFMT